MVTSFTSSRWAVCFCALLSFTLGHSAIAADVDVSLKPPASVGGDKLKARLRVQRDKVKNTDPLELTQEPGYVAEYSDNKWQLERLIDNKQSLAGLEEFGITPRPDGAVDVDVKNFPQWAPLSDLLRILQTPQDVDDMSTALMKRGFEDQDLEVLKAYVAENSRKSMMKRASLPLIEHYARIVRSKRVATLEEAIAHTYRLQRAWDEVDRVWAGGLLRRLSPQAGRILDSTLREMHLARTIIPDDLAEIERGAMREASFLRGDAYPAWIENLRKESAQ